MIQISTQLPAHCYGAAVLMICALPSLAFAMRHSHTRTMPTKGLQWQSRLAPYIVSRTFARATSDDSSHDHAQSETKRKQTWEHIKREVDERASQLRAQAAKHHAHEAKLRAQLAHHIRYARIYHTLAELEQDKFRLFALSIEKLNESCKYHQEPDLETETMLLQALHETYNQLYDALPEDEKI